MSPNYSPSLGNRAIRLGLKATGTMESRSRHGRLKLESPRAPRSQPGSYSSVIGGGDHASEDSKGRRLHPCQSGEEDNCRRPRASSETLPVSIVLLVQGRDGRSAHAIPEAMPNRKGARPAGTHAPQRKGDQIKGRIVRPKPFHPRVQRDFRRDPFRV